MNADEIQEIERRHSVKWLLRTQPDTHSRPLSLSISSVECSAYTFERTAIRRIVGDAVLQILARRPLHPLISSGQRFVQLIGLRT